MTDSKFHNRIAVITGGASGIGAACARQFTKEGATVVIADINHAAAHTLASELRVHAVKIDVASIDSVHQAAETVERDIGPVDILITSAGIIQKPLPPHELDMDDYDRVVTVDQRGTYITCRTFGTRMAKYQGGVIINIASITGQRSTPLHAYAPAKAAVIAITECLAAEWGRSGVRVNTISPGYTLTPAMQAAIDKGERDLKALTDNTAQGMMVTPEDIANAASFLASDQARAITGINLPVDAGWLVATSWHTYGGVREKYE